MEVDPVDMHIGKKIREYRVLRTLSQSALAKRLGVTFQQVQKYEKGANRLMASKLYHLAKIFEIEVSNFFADIKDEDSGEFGGSLGQGSHGVPDFRVDPNAEPASISDSGCLADPVSPDSDFVEDSWGSKDEINSRELLNLVRVYKKISDSRIRQKVYLLMKSLSLSN